MCAGETREAAFWESLHATTTRGTGPTCTISDSTVKGMLYGNAGRAATTPDDGSQGQRPGESPEIKFESSRPGSRLADTYDFLAEVDSGSNHMLPFLDNLDPSCPPQFDYNDPRQVAVKREPTGEDDKRSEPGPQNSTPPEDEPATTRQKQTVQKNTSTNARQNPEQPANEPEPKNGDDSSAKRLRRGLRPRSKPKQYAMYESEDSDGEWAPKKKKGVRKRTRAKKESEMKKGAAASLSSTRTGLSGRQERPLPPDLDEKQKKRILRNRASAERSRLKRLGQIAMLEQENRDLKQQLAEAQLAAASGNGGSGSQPQNDLMHENSMLRAELKMMRDRVQTLTCLLTTANQQAAGEMLGC